MAAAKQAVRRKPEPGARASELEIERRGGVLVLTLARPDRRNSLSEAMLAALQAAIDGAADDAGVRSVVIAAKGTAFCAGHDLKELTAHRQDADGGRAYFELLMRQCAEADALDRALPQAGDRGRAGHGAGRGLPAGRHLRPGGGGRGGDLLHAGRQYRAVLLHAHGGAVAQRVAQAGDGDAAAGRAAAGARGGRVRPRQPRGARPAG